MVSLARPFLVIAVSLGLLAPLIAQKAKIPPPNFPEWEDWSLLSSRKPSNARLASHTLPHADPYLQASYTWDNFVPQVNEKHKNLAYGNVLNGHREYAVKGRGKNTTAEYGGVISALEFALKAVVPAISNSVEAHRYWPNVTSEALLESLHITDYVLNQALVQPLRFTIDGKTHLAVDAEVPVSDRKLERKKHKPTFGIRFYLKVTAHVALHGGFPVPSQHTIIVFYDMARMFFMNTHSFYVGEPPHLRRITEATIDDSGVITSRNVAVDGDDVSVCVYNVWNSNPPSWLFHGYDRWKRYWLRMQLLADTIRSESPALITFQEVRYDTTLHSYGKHAQIAHLASLLPEYQYVYQPGTVYFHADTYPSHDEEGCAVFSKYPIVHSDYLVVSRDGSDREDEHQRVVIHALIAFPNGTLVDVYTTHLSLSQRARERTVVEIWKFIQSSRRGHLQILTGDMNGEPDQLNIQFLQGFKELEGIRTQLVDTWLVLHPEPEPRSPDPAVRRNMLTFPSDDPVKRIDFLLTANPDHRAPCKGTRAPEHNVEPPCVCTAIVDAVYLIGQDPHPSTPYDPKISNVGMTHRASLAYASDHRGVIGKLRFHGASTGTCPTGNSAT